MKKSIPPAFDHGRHKETEDAGTSESLQFVFEQQLEKIPWEGEFTIRSDLWAGLIASCGSFFPMVCERLKDEHQRRISPARSYQRLQSISSSMTCIWSIFDHCRSCWCWGNSVKTFRNCQETERSTMKTRECVRVRDQALRNQPSFER